jgi:hypothetical protein
MRVKELIKELAKMPEDAYVFTGYLDHEGDPDYDLVEDITMKTLSVRFCDDGQPLVPWDARWREDCDKIECVVIGGE